MREHPPQAALLDLPHIHSGAQGTGCETTRPRWARAGVTPSLVKMKSEGFENPKTKVQSVRRCVLIYLVAFGTATIPESPLSVLRAAPCGHLYGAVQCRVSGPKSCQVGTLYAVSAPSVHAGPPMVAVVPDQVVWWAIGTLSVSR